MKYLKQVIELRRTTTEVATVTMWVGENATSAEATEIAVNMADGFHAWGPRKLFVEKTSVHTLEEIIV